MYFNPTVLHPAQNEQIANSYRELADILINGVDRQRELHVEAIRRLCNAQESNIRALAKATNSAQMIRRGAADSTPALLEMWQVSAGSGAIAADVQRQVIELFGRYAEAMPTRLSQVDTPQQLLPTGHIGDRRDGRTKQMQG